MRHRVFACILIHTRRGRTPGSNQERAIYAAVKRTQAQSEISELVSDAFKSNGEQLGGIVIGGLIIRWS